MALYMLWPHGALSMVDASTLSEELLGFPPFFNFPSLAF